MKARRSAHAASKSPAPRPRAPAKPLALALQIAARGAQVPKAAQVRRWLLAALSQPAEVTVRIVGAAEARRLNRNYRGRDHAANVLSFPYGAERKTLRGDIVLCAPVIRREARAQGKTPEAHFAHLTVHGALHLQGHDHARPRDAARMEALEKKLLAKLGYPDPYRVNRES
ncbi:MAG: rRNA maturation RNase YbeY [Burkholderiales bacterium]